MLLLENVMYEDTKENTPNASVNSVLQQSTQTPTQMSYDIAQEPEILQLKYGFKNKLQGNFGVSSQKISMQNLVELIREQSAENSALMYNSRESLQNAILSGILVQSEENLTASDEEGLPTNQKQLLN